MVSRELLVQEMNLKAIPSEMIRSGESRKIINQPVGHLFCVPWVTGGLSVGGRAGVLKGMLSLNSGDHTKLYSLYLEEQKPKCPSVLFALLILRQSHYRAQSPDNLTLMILLLLVYEFEDYGNAPIPGPKCMFKEIYFMCVDVCPHVYTRSIHVYLQRPEEDTGFSGTGFIVVSATLLVGSKSECL